MKKMTMFKTQVLLLATATVLLAVVVARTEAAKDLDHREVKCLVCKATITEMESAIAKVDPKKTIGVGGFRLDTSGSETSKKIQYTKSEMYLTELMENICDKMDDYARARYKKTGRLTVLRLVLESGSMNPDMSEVDFVQDEDLNKSLKHYCLEILEDNEEAVLKLFMSEQEVEDRDIKLCTEAAGYCSDKPIEDDYELEDRDEL